MVLTQNLFTCFLSPYSEFIFHWHLRDYQDNNPIRRRQKLKLRVELSNWLTVFLMTSCQSLLKFLVRWAFNCGIIDKLTRFFKLVLTDKLTLHITFWWKYQQSKLFPFTSCSFHCIFRIHQLNGLLEDIGLCSTFGHGWANHQNVSGGTSKKWKHPMT